LVDVHCQDLEAIDFVLDAHSVAFGMEVFDFLLDLASCGTSLLK
jgi:hypothetical protein